MRSLPGTGPVEIDILVHPALLFLNVPNSCAPDVMNYILIENSSVFL